jgi:hypothetical protein
MLGVVSDGLSERDCSISRYPGAAYCKLGIFDFCLRLYHRAFIIQFQERIYSATKGNLRLKIRYAH